MRQHMIIIGRILTTSFLLQCRLEAASAAASTAAEAASAVAEQLPRLLAADQSAGVRQTALLALSSVASACGKERPDLVLAALPSALAATRDAQRPVRSSALATVAACTAALGTHALPQLVPLVTSVLLAVEAAGTALAAADDAQPAPKAKARNAVRSTTLKSPWTLTCNRNPCIEICLFNSGCFT